MQYVDRYTGEALISINTIPGGCIGAYDVRMWYNLFACGPTTRRILLHSLYNARTHIHIDNDYTR